MPLRALEYLQGPVKVEIGPWNHSWPDDGAPGPNYEWRSRAVRWWNHWLRDQDTGLMEEPRLLVFQRDGHPPDRNLVMTPGRWRFEDWPVPGARRDTLLLGRDTRLVGLEGVAGGGPACPPSTTSCDVALRYLPGYGTTVGDWWGEPSADMRRDDAGSLVFDGAPLDTSITVLGFPRMRLLAAHGAPLATWTARLEDVAPDGSVSLVTGAVLNATQHHSTTRPEVLDPGRLYDLAWDMHFTTWIFRPGHRIRLALSNAQFPMIWPTPYPMVSRVVMGSTASSIELPVVPEESTNLPPRLPVPEPRRERPDVRNLNSPGATERITRDQLAGTTQMEFGNTASWTIGPVRYDYSERQTLSHFGRRSGARCLPRRRVPSDSPAGAGSAAGDYDRHPLRFDGASGDGDPGPSIGWEGDPAEGLARSDSPRMALIGRDPRRPLTLSQAAEPLATFADGR